MRDEGGREEEGKKNFWKFWREKGYLSVAEGHHNSMEKKVHSLLPKAAIKMVAMDDWGNDT